MPWIIATRRVIGALLFVFFVSCLFYAAFFNGSVTRIVTESLTVYTAKQQLTTIRVVQTYDSDLSTPATMPDVEPKLFPTGKKVWTFDPTRLSYYQRPYEAEVHQLFRESATKLNWIRMPFDSVKQFIIESSKMTSTKPLTVLLMFICLGKDHAKYCNITRQRLDDYARLRGYTLYAFTEEFEKGYASTWQKMFAIRKFLRHSLLMDPPAFDVIAYFDNDVYITNLDVQIEAFIRLADQYAAAQNVAKFDMIVSRDILSNDPARFINAGVFLTRVTNKSLEIIEKVIENSHVYSHFLKDYCYEQSVLTITLYKHFAQNILVLPLCILQSFYENWSEHDFVLHLPGLDAEKRINILTNITKSIDFTGYRPDLDYHDRPCSDSRDMFTYS